MPAIVQILLVLALAIAGVLMITSRNPTTLTDEQQMKYAKILRVLIGILLIGGAIRFFFFN
jgi:cell division protein FtsW (lipid II flippase)